MIFVFNNFLMKSFMLNLWLVDMLKAKHEKGNEEEEEQSGASVLKLLTGKTEHPLWPGDHGDDDDDDDDDGNDYNGNDRSSSSSW